MNILKQVDNLVLAQFANGLYTAGVLNEKGELGCHTLHQELADADMQFRALVGYRESKSRESTVRSS